MRKFNLNIIILFFLYASLLIGFYYGEDLNGGAKADFHAYLKLISSFNENFKDTFLNFDKFGERHSPITVIILSQFFKFGLSEFFIRFLFLNINLLSILFFYKCLKVIFKDTDRFKLQLFSLIFLLSPTFRSLSIWPDSRILGFLFFLISLYYFLKFIHKDKKFNYVALNVIFLALASYISPNFSVFSLYFFVYYFLNYKFKIQIFWYVILNLILAFPAFYYIFVLDVFFLGSSITPGSENYVFFSISNFSNKILIILSILFFYFLPFLIYLKNQIFINNNDYLKKIFLTICILIISIFFFNYKTEYTGGGIFFHISNFIFKNNIFFFIISSCAIFIFIYRYSNLNNLTLLLILLLSNPQLTIYHKYYDPLVIVLFLTLFDFKFKSFFKNFNITIYVYLLYIFYITICIYRINFL